jgi:Right handed beta helix region
MKVRQLNQNMSQDIIVELADGVYELASPLQLSPEDSGTNGHNVRYVATQGAQPILSGGLTIQNWTIHDTQKNIYQATVPAGFYTRQLYVNGVRAMRAQLMLLPPTPGPATLGGGTTGSSAGYQVNISGMSEWTNVQDIEAVMSAYWQQNRCPLESVSQGQIVLQDPCWTRANAGPIHMQTGLNWLENAYAFLTEPGQWYLDRSANIVYYIPRSGEDLASARVVAGNLQQLVSGLGSLDASGNPQFVQNISFEGLTFAYATWLNPSTSAGFPERQSGVYNNGLDNGQSTPGAVNLSRARNITFARDRFTHLGAAALNLNTGSQGVVIEGNVFSDISGGAITVGDPGDNLETDPAKQSLAHTIANNYVTGTGVEYPGSSAVLIFYAANSSVANNEIANAPYTGLSVGWGWGVASYAANNQVTDNYIHDVMLSLFDGGGVYTLGSGGGTSLTGNYISNVGTTGPCGTSGDQYAGYSAIYHDAGGTLYSDTGNVITGVRCSGYWVLVQQGDTDVTLPNEFVDLDWVWGCPSSNGPGMSTCLNANGNSVTALTVFGSSPTAAAQSVMASAGLTSQYLDIKD